ncbi:MAG: GPI mannosyltransferase 1 [Phylliscum demangeonii]|nr:MAG: GPI mannosyltransferase 1 [Phylliscum demangeonii]
MSSVAAARFNRTTVFSAAIALRIGLLVYGYVQDAYSPMKYTDIDYYVFTDAARYVSQGQSPYDRDTYRYTPLLAWLLLPATWYPWSFSFGKMLFASGDIFAGWLILLVLQHTYRMSAAQALKFASIWLLNPMVAAISTRGSSEGLLGVMVVALLWAVTRRKIRLAGMLLGLAVHFKIYPFIYGFSILWWLDAGAQSNVRRRPGSAGNIIVRAARRFNPAQIALATSSLMTFFGLSGIMAAIYGTPFIRHTYLYHLIRIDHRHNFSVYNTLLYLNSSPASSQSALHLESLAFLPQLFLSAFAIPAVLAKKDLAATMLAQTFAFVTFNKVCTSQYFLWYMIFLPFYLPKSSLLSHPRLGIPAVVLWVLSQAFWLQQAYQLEYLGKSTFVPGLWAGGVVFFLTNVCLLAVVISDVGRAEEREAEAEAGMRTVT